VLVRLSYLHETPSCPIIQAMCLNPALGMDNFHTMRVTGNARPAPLWK
jgi:hypothetical protein